MDTEVNTGEKSPETSKTEFSTIISSGEEGGETKTESETYSSEDERKVRSEKNTEADNVIGILKPGQSVDVIEPVDKNNWIGIRFKGAVGYIKIK